MNSFYLVIISILIISGVNAIAQTAPIVEKTTIGEINDSTIFSYVDDWPQFPGGDDARKKFFSENVIYPTEAERLGLEGRVIVAFIIEKDGSVSNVQALKKVDPILDEEAIRVVKLMPHWKPAAIKGQIVRCKFKVDIIYRIPVKNSSPSSQ